MSKTKDVLVVIGIGGMGEAIVRRSGSGKKVVLADLDRSRLDLLRERLEIDGFDVEVQPTDVADQASMVALADTAKALGPITAAVHTAGLSTGQAPVEKILQVDLLGVAYFLDVFGEVIAPGGAGVVIASMSGTMFAGVLGAQEEQAIASAPTSELLTLARSYLAQYSENEPAYPLSKRANQLRVQIAAATWGVRGARINSISPGVIATPMSKMAMEGQFGAHMRALVEASAVGEAGTASDIAAAVAFLISPESRFITGTDLLVDGGAVATARFSEPAR